MEGVQLKWIFSYAEAEQLGHKEAEDGEHPEYEEVVKDGQKVFKKEKEEKVMEDRRIQEGVL